jgi:hypothetical protein
MDLSGALELGADSAQRFLKVLVERRGLQLRQSFPTGRCRLSTLVTVGHDLIAPCEEVLAGCAFCETDPSRSI